MAHRALVAAILAALCLAAACGEEDERRNDRFDDDGSVASVQGSGGASASSASTGGASSATTSSAGPTSSSSGESCLDTGTEPNDSEGSAVDLGIIDDCDESGSSTAGVLAPGDVDWFRYGGTDGSFCVVGPFRSLSADFQARICKYVSCPGATVSCPTNATPDTSPGGLPGCCAVSAFELGMNCSGGSDDATIYIRIDQTLAACNHYTLSFHY